MSHNKIMAALMSFPNIYGMYKTLLPKLVQKFYKEKTQLTLFYKAVPTLIPNENFRPITLMKK